MGGKEFIYASFNAYAKLPDANCVKDDSADCYRDKFSV
jgi:hypothetical protein